MQNLPLTFTMLDMKTLYIIPTPIGNLEDISNRSLRILKEVDLILAEDTRTTGKLLKHFEIDTKTMSYHMHSDQGKIETIKELLQEKDIALVSDAGTPGISDPGSYLVGQIRKELPDVRVEGLPGPCAVTTALSASGLPADSFTFLGFVPHKKGRQTFFQNLSTYTHTVVFYESPHRILKTLTSLTESLSEDAHVVIARELTKMFEEYVHGTPQEVSDYFTNNPDKVRGEFVVMIKV